MSQDMPPLPTEFGHLCSWRITTTTITEQNVVAPSALIVPVYSADQMHAYAAPLLARIAELERDAARYRWLRDNATKRESPHDHPPLPPQ
jgi:hypothetical protein